jgi:hypothetical protein
LAGDVAGARALHKSIGELLADADAAALAVVDLNAERRRRDGEGGAR